MAYSGSKTVHSSTSHGLSFSQLESVFTHALRLKADLLLTRKRYKAEFVQIDTNFDPGTMKQDGWSYEGLTQEGSTGTTATPPTPQQRVRMCLFPAIYSVPLEGVEKEWSTGVALHNCVVDYRNFITTGDSWTAWERSQATLITKALVIPF
ncbi:hypothetical protein JX265_007011 [Neoarthrinium moseri]|uniref:Uncharacterized protein n=1 Tax=Neoarthrinium moseri TaxID=1658444 RepID=A0A9P9WKI4_9PEZI|nr:hypothetical protein JX266_009187 [Neoarthrinium moseri]KAI1868188.1 hypothetical protein JX265_007011 [Neoarthrinium moseri]